MNAKEVESEHKRIDDKISKDLGIEVYKPVAIGYLDITEEYKRGYVPQKFIDKLRILFNEGISIATMGFHECEFCIDEERKDRGKSSSEKTLRDDENKIKYIFPEMIFHYIEEHNFKPSDEFITFIMLK